MTDLVTNAYGKTDAFGKGNLANVIGGSAGSESLKGFYKTNYKMTDADWVSLFGENNVIYKNTNTVINPVSLLNQTTIKTNNIDLFTADIVLQVMKKLEKAIQTTKFVHTQYKALEDSLYDDNSLMLKMYHMLNMTSFGTPQATLFNEYILNQILSTRIKRRYVIIEDNGSSYFTMDEIEIFDHEKNKISISDSQITTSSNYPADIYYPGRLVDNKIPGSEREAWHSAWMETRNSLVPYSDRLKHHIIIDLGSSKDIGKIIMHSRNRAGNYESDNHFVYLTDHLYWRQTLAQPLTVSGRYRSTAFSNMFNLQPQPEWISDPDYKDGTAPSTGSNNGWQYNPSVPDGSQIVFTYVFDGRLDPIFKKYGTGEFRLHMDAGDLLFVYVNGERYGLENNSLSPLSPFKYNNINGHVRMIQTSSEVNRFDFVVQNTGPFQNTGDFGSTGGPFGLLATVDYKVLALPLKKHQYVYVQLDDSEEAGKWAEIKVFDENNALLTPISSMVAPFDGTGGLHHDGNLLTFSDTTDSSTIASAYDELYNRIGEDIDGTKSKDNFGRSVSMSDDGTIIAIGAPNDSSHGTFRGQVRVYNYASASNTWEQLGSDINGENNSSYFGTSVSISNDGTIVAIGATGAIAENGKKTGQLQVYKYENLSWTQLGADIDGEDSNDNFGTSVSMNGDGTVLAAGAEYGNKGNSGYTRIYKYASNAWTLLGARIIGEAANDFSGSSVSLSDDGTIIAIGAWGNDDNGTNSGHTRIYKYASNAWTKLGADIDGEKASDYSGRSVSLSSDGTVVAIGSQGNDGNGSSSGHTRIYKYASNAWTKLGADIDGENASDNSGYSVSLSNDGTVVAIGAIGNDDNGTNSGHIRIYKYASNTWTKIDADLDGEHSFSYSGYSVSLSGDGSIVAVGAPKPSGYGSIRVYKLQQIPLPTHKSFLESTKFERSSKQGAWAMVDLGGLHTISKIELYGEPDRDYFYGWFNYEPSISSHKVYLKGSDGTNTEIIQLISGNSSVASVNTINETVVDTVAQTSTIIKYKQTVATYNISSSISEGTFESTYAITEEGPLQEWARASATGSNVEGWTMSERHQTMIGSDTIQLPAMSALHTETSDRKHRQTIYNFPSSTTDPIIDMGGTPVSFIVEHITKYKYVIVQIDNIRHSHWSAIEAYDENGELIEVSHSSMSSTYDPKFPSTLHHDGDMNTFSHTENYSTNINGEKRGPWSMITLAKLSTITEIRVISRNYTGNDRLERRHPFRVFLTDTFIDNKLGDDTFEFLSPSRTSVSQVGEQFTFIHTNLPKHYPNDLSWDITQDTDNQIVASSEHISQSTLLQTNTINLDEKHLGYTGSYTLTMRDSTGAWDTYYQMKVTSRDIHGRSTLRKVTRRDITSQPLNGLKVSRMHLSGDTTPIRNQYNNIIYNSTGGPTGVALSLQNVYENKLKHIKDLLKSKGQKYEPSRNHIANIYDTAIATPIYTEPTTSEFWWPGSDHDDYNTMVGYQGAKASGSIGYYMVETGRFSKGSTDLILHDLMTNIYDIHFNDDTDISMYELQPKDNPTYTKFTNNKILFTSRLGYAIRYKIESLAYYLRSTSVRNDIPLSQFASEMAVEMLQNSSLKSFSSEDTSLSHLPMSCGYEIVTDKDDATNVLNVRMYVSHIIDHPFEEGKQLSISSGVNLFDFVDIKKFSKGVSSSNFITHLTETIQTLNSDPFANFNETAYTTWEYGTPAEYDSLKCVSSPSADYWTGKLIKDCQLKGSTEDVPKRIFFILDYINTHYVELYNNQYIIINDINGIGKVVSIIRITIAYDDKITFQSRDSHVDYLFPIANVNADMVVNGELQVANYKGEVLLHVDPVTDKSMLMGKMGINQEMHDITAMLDIDNLSNKNLLDFSKRFMPLILDSVTKMDTFITYNPYNDNPTTKIDKTAAILDLKVYTSMPAAVEPTRELRFGTLQARVELPVRIYVVIAAYRTLHDLDDETVKIRVHYDRCFGHQESLEKRLEYHEKLLADAKANLKETLKAEKEEAENMSFWAKIAEAALNIAVALLPGAALLMKKVIFGATGFDVSDSIESLADNADSDAIKAHIEHIEADIEQNEKDVTAATTRTDEAEAKIAPHADKRAAQQIVVNDAMADMQTQAGLLGLSDLYDSLVLWQSRVTIAIRMYTVHALYMTTKVNAWIKEKAPDYKEGPEWAFDDTLVTASETNIGNAISELNAKFLEGAKSYIPNTDEYGAINSSINAYVDSQVSMSLTAFLDMYQNNMSGVGDKTLAVIADMKSKPSNNKRTASFLNTYLENAQTEVARIKKNIRSNESNDMEKSTRATLTLDDTSQEEFVAYQEVIDTRRAELVVEERRLNALNWVLKSFPEGAYSSSGDTTISGYISGWKATIPHGFILSDTKIYDGNSNKKLKEFAAYIRPKALTAKAASNARIELLKQQISEVDNKQNGLMDNLQEYTSSHDWNVETHNRLKHLISDIYRMYLRYGATMKSSGLSYTCILPVTTISDNLTSAMYIKIVLSLEDAGQPQMSLSGRLLDVTEFTRDLSYRETLMQLMQGFSAGSQLVNYGSVLLVKNVNDFAKTPVRNSNNALLLSDVIREDALFINRFGSESLYLVIDNISDSTIVQHERYAHWNGKETSSLFHPGTNTRVSSSYKTMNDTFITNYGFDPTTTAFDNPLLSNMYMVPHKYDDVWKLAIVRYIAIDQTLYRVSCVIDVGDYLDQSIITKGDSTFHGDFTVKSSDNREIFQIDTLNNTSANLYPLSIGAQQPRTMLDVQDASIMDINYFITKVSKGMRELTAVYEPTTIVLGNTDDYKYKYRFNMDTKKAEDTLVVFHELYPIWGNLTYSEIMEFDKDRASIIKNSILPALQRVIDTTFFYPGSIYSTRIEFTSGMKYSVHKIVKINVPIEDAVAGGVDSYNYVEAIGQGWDIQTYGINIITNPNVEKLFDNLDANIEFINFVRYRTNNTGGGPLDIPHNIQAITDKYKSIRNDVYRYDLKNVTSVLEQKVSPAEVSVIYEIAKNNNDRPIAISKLTNKEERIYHTSFIVDYTKDYDGETNRLPVGDFGIIPCRDSNYYYYAMFYKLGELTNDISTTVTGSDGTQVTTTTSSREASIAVFFVNMTKDHILPSMSIEGDLAVAGELTLSGLTTRQNAASIYLTVDPENHFVGINSNDRFANYSLKHTSEALGSIYDTSQHLYVKNDRYPNATFARIAENADTTTNGRDYDATKDYTLFGTHSSATMLRSSDMWTYRETLQQAEHYTTSLTNLTTNAYNTLEDWQKKKRYGTDIAFEIKDVSGVTTELGEVQMVIDSIDAGGSLHAGFGVQVVDRTRGTIFPQALKNIMYVNNDSELFVNGVMLGGKLFKSDGVDLFWGDKKVKFEE
jgi:hypothetical protein